MSSSTNDKTVNKVAICSAIFAGFAYVGYAVARTAFGKRGKRDGGRGDAHHLYFRRLSQTTQTDVLLGNLDLSGSGKVMLRSVTVQERIRELNLRARMFADTMLAIQTAGNTPVHHHRVVTKSLQASPWNSPRVLSPVDMQHILNSRSTENLHVYDGELEFDISSPVKRRWTRRNVCKKSPERNRSRNNSTDRQQYVNVNQQARELLKKDEEGLKSRLNSISEQSSRMITSDEAKAIVTLLYSTDDDVLIKAVTTIGNLGTFSDNQKTFREAQCLYKISTLITHPNIGVKLSALCALSNLVLNKENQEELKDIIPLLILMLKAGSKSEEYLRSILVLLTNFAVLPEWHDLFYPVLHTACDTIDKGSLALKLQALKLLINLSCNENMVPSLLAAQAPRRLIYLLDMSTNEDILLRVLTLLSNLTAAVKQLKIDPIDLPVEDKAASPETMYAALYGVNMREKLHSKILGVMNNHANEEIRNKCKKICEALA